MSTLLHDCLSLQIPNHCLCMCGSKKVFIECCQPILSGQHPVNHPEQLMRARFNAFKFGLIRFLDCTDLIDWHQNGHDLNQQTNEQEKKQRQDQDQDQTWIKQEQDRLLNEHNWIKLVVHGSGFGKPPSGLTLDHMVQFCSKPSTPPFSSKMENISASHRLEKTGWVAFSALYLKPNSSSSQQQTRSKKKRFTTKLQIGRLDEISLFTQTGLLGWIYNQGEAQWASFKPKPNQPCICHSGRKWKLCCKLIISRN